MILQCSDTLQRVQKHCLHYQNTWEYNFQTPQKLPAILPCKIICSEGGPRVVLSDCIGQACPRCRVSSFARVRGDVSYLRVRPNVVMCSVAASWTWTAMGLPRVGTRTSELRGLERCWIKNTTRERRNHYFGLQNPKISDSKILIFRFA